MYETAPSDASRDTTRARQLVAEGAEHIEHDRLEKAATALKAAIAADVTYGPAHNNLGVVYLRQHELYLAAWEFEYACRLMPGKAEPKNNLGLVLERAGRLDGAVEQFEQAHSLESDQPQFLGNLARARVRRGDRGSEVVALLKDVVLKDSRPEWSDWAKRTIALLNKDRGSLPDAAVIPPETP
jgi:Flp pilus assembly protein TadD